MTSAASAFFFCQTMGITTTCGTGAVQFGAVHFRAAAWHAFRRDSYPTAAVGQAAQRHDTGGDWQPTCTRRRGLCFFLPFLYT